MLGVVVGRPCRRPVVLAVDQPELGSANGANKALGAIARTPVTPAVLPVVGSAEVAPVGYDGSMGD